MEFFKLFTVLLSFLSITLAESFCNDAEHSGESIELNVNQKGNVGPVDYELWASGGDNTATFYTDGSFTCGFNNATDYLCRAGVNITPAKLPSEIGHIKAEFKVEKTYFENVQYSYIGVYGWTIGNGINFVFEYYIVDDVLVPIPDDFANELIGDFVIDGAEYTVYRNTKDMLTQYFSVRKEPRSCGTIDVTAHFEQWEKLGFVMGTISEVKVLGEAGNDFGNVYGSLNFPYARVYIDGELAQSQAYTPVKETTSAVEEPTVTDAKQDEEPTVIAGEEEQTVTAEADEEVTDADSSEEEQDVTVEADEENDDDADSDKDEESEEEPTTNGDEPAIVEEFCKDAAHSGESIELNVNQKGNVGPVDYELWASGGDNTATFYTDGSFTCGFNNATDYLCRAGVNISPAKLPSEIGHIKAEFKVEKTYFENVQYSYIGVYGWTIGNGINFVFEYYIVDDVLVPIPDDFANELIGDFVIDGAEYTVYRNTKDMLTQYFSVRKEPRSCGTIDVTAHFEQWEKLGFVMGTISEVKVLGEAGNDFGNVYGSLNFPYARVYIDGELAQSQAYTPVKETTNAVEEPTNNVE